MARRHVAIQISDHHEPDLAVGRPHLVEVRPDRFIDEVGGADEKLLGVGLRDRVVVLVEQVVEVDPPRRYGFGEDLAYPDGGSSREGDERGVDGLDARPGRGPDELLGWASRARPLARAPSSPMARSCSASEPSVPLMSEAASMV